MSKKDDLPPCGRCGGSGKLTYQRPRKITGRDGKTEVEWYDSLEHCTSCGGSGKCR